MNNNFDLLIIGGGAAAMSASIYASRYELTNTIVSNVYGGTTSEAHLISNYPGFKEISGNDLMGKMTDHAQSLGAKIMLDEVITVTGSIGAWQAQTKNSQSLTAKAILFCSGTSHKHLGLPAEARLSGKGVSYCATCDGPFYKNKTVAVIGGGNSAVGTALYLSDIAQKVYLIARGPALKGEPTWLKELPTKTNCEVILNTNVIDLGGEVKLEKLILDKAYQDKTELAVDGLFVEVGLAPRSELFKTMGGEIDDQGYIKVDPEMNTNLPGVWAAGDVSDASAKFRQIVTATAEGAIAADSVYRKIKRT